MGVLLGVVTVALFSYVAWASVEATKRRSSTLSSLGSWLGSPYEVGGNFVTGKRNGVKVKLAYETRRSGSAAESWTEVSVDIPPAYPLTLYVRRHTFLDRAKIAAGEMFDLKLGDRAFDDAYLVEAAPTDVVRELIDHRARAYMMGASHMELVTERRGDTAILKLSVRRWDDELLAAKDLVEEALRLARRVREVYAKVTAGPLQAQGSPFRPVLQAAIADAAPAREAEVEQIRALGPKRAAQDLGLVLVLLVVSVAGCLMIATVWLAQKLS